MSVRRLIALATTCVATLSLAVAVIATDPAGAATATPVLEKRIIGYSVKHRPIVAYHLGNPRYKRTSVILGQMHGDEPAGIRVVNSLVMSTSSIEGTNLWVIPTMNPDGNARHTRQNAHKVDLNRNWPDNWRHLTGQYYSGPRVLSEPETRAVHTFLRKIRPHYLVSLHQPLRGVDATDGARLDKAFRNRLARNLKLPIKAFNCWSVCYGSMTPWYTKHNYGLGFTIEFGRHPSTYMLTKRTPWGIVHALGGTFGSLAAHNPSAALSLSATAVRVLISGWAYDTDDHPAHVSYRAYRDGTLIRTSKAWSTSPPVPKRIPAGAHGYAFTDHPTPGAHNYCLVFANLGAGTGATRLCRSVTVPDAP